MVDESEAKLDALNAKLDLIYTQVLKIGQALEMIDLSNLTDALEQSNQALSAIWAEAKKRDSGPRP